MDASITSPQFHAAICVIVDLIHWRMRPKTPRMELLGGHSLRHLIKKKKKEHELHELSVTYPQVDPWNVKNKTSIQT